VAIQCRYDAGGTWLAVAAPEMTIQQRREYRDRLVQILPEVPGGRAGNSPLPTGSRRPMHCRLILKPCEEQRPARSVHFFNGKRKVRTKDDWQARRAEIRQLLENMSSARCRQAQAGQDRSRGRGGSGPRQSSRSDGRAAAARLPVAAALLRRKDPSRASWTCTMGRRARSAPELL